MLNEKFVWESTGDQIYSASNGSQTIKQDNLDKEVGKLFVMDAPGCGLTLSLDSNEGRILWPVPLVPTTIKPATIKPATIEVINGDLFVYSEVHYIGVDPDNFTHQPIALNFSKNSRVEFNCNDMFHFDIDKSSEMCLRDDAILAILSHQGVVVLGGGVVNVFDNSELMFRAEAFDFRNNNADESLRFTVGFGNNSGKCTSSVVFSSFSNGNILKSDNIPKGVFNFSANGEGRVNNSKFVFDNAFGFYKSNLPDRELFSVDNEIIHPVDFDKFFYIKNKNNANLSAGFEVYYTGREL